MAPLTTDDFPYTARYLQELLGLDESALSALIRALQLQPAQDPYTQADIFSSTDLELLRQAVDLNRQGLGLKEIVGQLRPGLQNGALANTTTTGRLSATSGSGLGGARSSESLAVLVDAISSSKDSIMEEISRLLDDRLSGLDEVVVELIRCKSENDALRQKLSQAIREKEGLQEELGKFKPVQFGFFKKIR